MRAKVVFRPGAGGMITDIPSNLLKSDSVPYAKDVIFHRGVARERWGFSTAWQPPEYLSTGEDVLSVARVKFKLANRTCWISTSDSGWIYADSYHPNDTDDDKSYVGYRYSQPLVRCVYRDEAIICYSGGNRPIGRYSGGNIPRDNLTGTATYTQNQATITSSTTSANDHEPGEYVKVTLGWGAVCTHARIVYRDFGNTTWTFEDAVHLDATSRARAFSSSSYGEDLVAVAHLTFPCVSVDDRGTASVSTTSGQATGYGTEWGRRIGTTYTDSEALDAYNIAILYKNSGNWQVREIVAASDNDTLSLQSDTGTTHGSTTASQYEILAPPMWTDATVHKGSLWGSGVKYHPNRVYVAPPGWNPAYPPGATYPYDVSENLSKADANFWKLDFVDVPSRDDADAVVAILPTNGPLLVLKRSSVYAIHGTYPNFEVSLLSQTSGCLAREAAVTVDSQPYWADRNGIYTYRGGQVVDLTAGKISREWRGLLNGWQGIPTSKIAIGGVAGHVVVSLVNLDSTKTLYGRTEADTSSPSQRTLVYSLEGEEWVSRFSNVEANCLGSIRVEGEPDALVFGTRDGNGAHYDLAPCFTGYAWDWAAPTYDVTEITYVDTPGSASAAKTYDEDGVGTTPLAEIWTPSNLAERAGVDGESRMIDASLVHVNHDTGSTRSHVIKVSQDLGRLSDQSATAVTVATVGASSSYKLKRTRFRVARSGRTHQVQISLSGAPTTNSKDQEFHELVCNFRDPRSRP